MEHSLLCESCIQSEFIISQTLLTMLWWRVL